MEYDEWKMAFSNTSGLYQYRVIPYGLSCTPSVFQCFISNVLRDKLEKFVIAYINDILIYSSSLQSYIGHVKEVLSHI